jgi:hypothetical protein
MAFTNNGQQVSHIVHFAAHAYPTNAGDPAILGVKFTVWWPALGPQSGPWKIACVATSPSGGDVFSCDADLAQLGSPPGQLLVSFDVYDQAGNSNLSPNGEHTVYYQPPATPTPTNTPTSTATPTNTPAFVPREVALSTTL